MAVRGARPDPPGPLPSEERGPRIALSAPWLLPLALGAVGLIGYARWAVDGGLVRQGNWVGVDFHVYYTAAQVLRRGQDIYGAGIAPPYVYPPLLAILVVPLALLPITAATIAWKVLQHLCLLVAGGLLLSLLPRGVRPLATGLLLLAWLLVPLHDEIQVGESNSLVLVLEMGAVWLIARGRAGRVDASATFSAGLLLALAASIKVLPVLLIAYFWWRGPRPVAAAATGGFVALQLLAFLITHGTAEYWFVQFPALFGQAFPFLDNQSLNAAIARALLPSDPAGPSLQLADGAALRPLLTWLANLVVLLAAGTVLALAAVRSGGSLFRSQGVGPTPPPAEASTPASPIPAVPAPGSSAPAPLHLLLEIGFVLLTIHLVSGSTWLHHLIDLAVPLCAFLGLWWQTRAASTARPHTPSRISPALIGGLAAGFLLLLVRPADWVTLVAGLVPDQPLLNWLASNTALAVVLACWIFSIRLLSAAAPPRYGPEITARQA